jgi:hypothetical protein
MMGRGSEARMVADAIKRMVSDPQRHPARFGLVEDVDKAGFVKVEIQPEGDLTDFIRYVGLGMSMGPWRGLWLPPKGAEVLLLSTDPDAKSYIALGSCYNGEDLAPEAYDEGSILFEHESGSKLLLDADGTIYLGGKDGAEEVVLKSWIESKFNALVSHINTTPHLHPMGPTSGPAASFVSWSSGNVSTKFKGV